MTRNYATIGRPRPLIDAAKGIGTGTAFAGAVASFLASWGLMSADQSSALNLLFAAVPGVIGLLTGVLAAFGVASKAEPRVTPVSDPQDQHGQQLTPAGT